MRRTMIKTVVPCLGLLLLAGSSLAATIEIPAWGDQVMTTIDPGRQWTDDEGILHYRDLIQTAEMVGQDIDGNSLAGSVLYIVDINIDPVAGDGDTNVRGTIEFNYGDLSGTFEGRCVGTISGGVVDGEFNFPRGTDDFDGWKFQGTWSHVFASGYAVWEGNFLIPGGDKSSVIESTTWTSVKKLFD
jgi:hypothetical protein